MQAPSLDRVTQALPYMLLPALVLAAYLGSVSGGFVYDDWPMIAENEAHIGRLAAVPNYFLSGIWENSNVGGADVRQYRPVVLVWYFLVHSVAGMDPQLWRMANLALHSLNAILVAFCIGRLFPDSTRLSRIAGGAVLAAHPAAAFSVAWISGVSDVLLAAFALSALLIYQKARETGATVHFVGVVCCCVLAVLNKETGILLPIAIVAYDLCYRARHGDLPVAWYAALLFMVLIYFGVRMAVLGGAIEGDAGFAALDGNRLWRFFDYGVMYVRLLVIPWPLPFYFEHPGFTIAGPGDVVIAAVSAGVMVWAAVKSRASRFALVWICLSIGLATLIAFREPGTFNPRYLYLPVIGIAVMVGSGLTALRRLWPPAPAALAPVLVAVLAVGAHGESLSWKDQIAWSERAIHDNPNSVKGYWHLARHYLRTGDRAAAVRTYEQALTKDIGDDASLVLTEDLMELYVADRRFEDTLRIYRDLSRIDAYAAIGYTGMGNSYWSLGRPKEALAAFETAITLDPEQFDALYGHASVSETLGDRVAARSSFERLVAVAAHRRLNANQKRALDRARGFLARERQRR